MTAVTEDQAAGLLCPLARTFATPKAVPTCQGPHCALWRWVPVTTSSPDWKRAVQAETERTQEKVPYPKAARYVADNMQALGLVPTQGYCGAGGPV